MSNNHVYDIQLENTEIIGWSAILKHANGNAKQAEFVLINFVSELFHAKKRFYEARQMNDQQALQQAIEKLAHICQYCSVPRLHEAVTKYQNFAGSAQQIQWLDVLSQEMEGVLNHYRLEYAYG